MGKEHRLPIAIFTIAVNIKSWGVGLYYAREKLPTNLGNKCDEMGYVSFLILCFSFHIRFTRRQKQDWSFYFDTSSRARYTID